MSPTILVAGISYLVDHTLCISINQQSPFGKSVHCKLGLLSGESVSEVSADQALSALAAAYQAGYEAQAAIEEELAGIAVAGFGDPLLALEKLAEIVSQFKTERHGVPVKIVTFGLVDYEQQESVAQALVAMEVEAADIYFPASTPKEYVEFTGASEQDFGKLCAFVEALSSAGIKVTGIAGKSESVNTREARSLAQALGAVDYQLVGA